MANTLYLGNVALIDLSGYYTKSEVDSAIENVDVTAQLDDYVQKDGDKVLSSNDFTDALKTKLEGLSNFDATDINGAIEAIQTTLGDITGEGKAVTDALDTWSEIKAFIADYSKSDSVASILSTLESNIHSWVEGKGYLTEHQSLAEYAKTSDIAAAYQPKGEYLTEHQSLSDYLKSADAATAYQPKGEYVAPSAISDMETKTHATATFQAKGNYALASEISDMETKTHAAATYQAKGEYVTVSELSETEQAIASNLNDKVTGVGVSAIKVLTSAEYAELTEKSATVLYIVKD